MDDDDFWDDDPSDQDSETDDPQKWDVFLPDDEIDLPNDRNDWQDEEDE